MVDKCQLVQLAAELRIKLKKELPKGKLEQTIYTRNPNPKYENDF